MRATLLWGQLFWLPLPSVPILPDHTFPFACNSQVKEQPKPKEELLDPMPKMTPLEASRHAHFGGKEPPEDRGLLIDGKEVARLLGVSPRTVWPLKDCGRMPKPIRIGTAARWSYEDIKEWIEQGCPSQRRGRGCW